MKSLSFNSAFGARLRSARIAVLRSVREVADAVGLSPAAYSSYERGSFLPHLKSFVAIADFLQTPADSLLGRNVDFIGSFGLARQFWIDKGCEVFDHDGAVELVLIFNVPVERIGSVQIRSNGSTFFAVGRRSIFFDSHDSFINATDSILSKTLDFCIAEALSYADS